jgi:hypothetical protein
MKNKSRLPATALLVGGAVALGATVLALSTAASGAAAGSTPESFAGYWHVHDAELVMYPVTAHPSGDDWYGVEIDDDNGAVTVLLSLSLSANGEKMKASVDGVGYSNTSGKAAALPDPGENLARGDSFTLSFVHPYLLRMTAVHTAHANVVGNPYWCGTAIASQYSHYCGA